MAGSSTSGMAGLKVSDGPGPQKDNTGDPLKWVFQDEHIIGNGSFGVVYQAIVQGSNPPRVRFCAKPVTRAQQPRTFFFFAAAN